MSSKAQAAKEKGNAAFKTGDFVGAIGHYTDAHLADRLEPTYPLNRAAAYLKLGKFSDAERDCTTTLALSHGNVKALFRRAQARVALRKLDEAEKDLNEVLRKEPTNDPAKQELAKLAKLREEIKASKKTPISVTPPAVAPHSGPAEKPAQKPVRRRIPIEIVEDGPPTQSAAASSRPVEPTGGLLSEVSTRSLASQASVPASTPAPPKSILKPPPTTTSSSIPASFQATRDSREQANRNKVGGGIFRSNGTHTLFKGSSATPASSAPETSPTASIVEVAPAASPVAQSVSSLSLPVSPAAAKQTTLFALEREWSQARSVEARWACICNVPPSTIPALCKTSLEPEFLTKILATFRDVASIPAATDAVRTAIRDYLASFAQVSRFDTLVMFLSASEKATIRDLLAAIGLSSWGGVSSK